MAKDTNFKFGMHVKQELCYCRENCAMHFGTTEKPTRESIPPIVMLALTPKFLNKNTNSYRKSFKYRFSTISYSVSDMWNVLQNEDEHLVLDNANTKYCGLIIHIWLLNNRRERDNEWQPTNKQVTQYCLYVSKAEMVCEDNTAVVWCSLIEEHPRIFAQTLYF